MGHSSDARHRTVELTADHARYIDRLVADGAFASDSEVVNAGLQALRERDDEVELWLREEVVPTYDRMQADPSRGLSTDEIRRRLQAGFEDASGAAGQCNET